MVIGISLLRIIRPMMRLKRYLSRGSKEYSVLIEPELLEKMAADESVKEKYLGIIDDARNKISEVKDEVAKLDDGEDGVKKPISRILDFP